MIDFYYWPTPNGHKVSMMLEETGLEYRVIPVDIGKGQQFDPAFLAISPNNKMPAIVDHAAAGGGTQNVFESGAILLYLAEKSGRFVPRKPRERIACLEWLFWQVGGLGPMTGQYGHFHVYAPEKIPYAMDRYATEALRLLGVLDRRLEQQPFLAGAEYSIADMACYPWIDPYSRAPLDLARFTALARWRETIATRAATVRAYALTTQVNPNAGTPMSDAEKRILFGQGPRDP